MNRDEFIRACEGEVSHVSNSEDEPRFVQAVKQARRERRVWKWIRAQPERAKIVEDLIETWTALCGFEMNRRPPDGEFYWPVCINRFFFICFNSAKHRDLTRPSLMPFDWNGDRALVLLAGEQLISLEPTRKQP